MFWVDIFATYKRSDYVLHHREHPGIVFKVYYDQQIKFKTKTAKSDLEYNLKKPIYDSLQRISNNQINSKLDNYIFDQLSQINDPILEARKIISEKLVRSQQGIKEKYKSALERANRYLPIIESIFIDEYNLPIELTRLPFVESSFDYEAYSSVGAAGIWQFMPRTAKSYMKVNRLVDERRDVIEATRGAAQYLKSAYQQLGNWGLATTSYNHGVGGVRKRIRQGGSNNIEDLIDKKVFGFASGNFFPELLAAIYIYDNRGTYFPRLNLEKALSVHEYKLPYSYSLKYILKHTGLDKETIKKYNYGLLSPVWNNSYRIPSGYTLKLPKDRIYSFNMLKIKEPGAAKTIYSANSSNIYRVKKGDSLGKIASRFGTSINNLKKINNLKRNTIYVNQKLKVSGSKVHKSSYASTQSSSKYKVRKGDSLGKIAAKYNVTISSIKSLNKLKNNNIYAGQILKINSSKSFANSSIIPVKSTYKVRKGDTLGLIAAKHKMSLSKLKSLNGLKSSRIYIGQVLNTSSSYTVSKGKVVKTYKVRKGDSLGKIADKYKIGLSKLKKDNNLKGNTIYIGQKLKIN